MSAPAMKRAERRRILSVLVAASAVLLCSACGSPSPLEGGLERRDPLPPQQALGDFGVAEGFRIELAASEPNVADPIAAAFDEDGRLYVAEMRGYPLDPPPGGRPAGRIRLLVDSDADGVYETASVFADGLHWPSGIACWKGGVFVTAAPDILYLRDTTGDGRGDLRRTVFTGFGTGKSEDIVNNLRWGMDGWIYGATSYNGGAVRPAAWPAERSVPLGSSDFRFHPVTEVIDAVAGTGGDFGNDFDDWGNRFGSNSGSPVLQAVFPLRHVVAGMEPPRLAAPALEWDGRILQVSAPEPWRVARKSHWSRWVDTTREMRARRFPPAELAERGYYTGGAGLAVYRGAAYPAEFRGDIFAAEPAGNLVVRVAMQRSGVAFRGRRVADGGEFLASTDNWFRPVNLVSGPDGCLYVLDMYREVIEDPSAIPEEILSHVDYYTGQDMGRVYRIAPDGFARRPAPRLSAASDAELVSLLADGDGWWRDTAHRLLLERQARAAGEAVAEVARSSPSPQGRLHALWLLEGLGQLDERQLARALDDPHPQLRRNAVRLCESRLAGSPALRDKVASLAEDEDAAVRFQVALAAPALDPAGLTRRLAQILSRDPSDEWIRAAVLAGARSQPLSLLGRVLQDGRFLADAGSPGAVKLLASQVAERETPESIEVVLRSVRTVSGPRTSRFSIAALAGVAAGLARKGDSLAAVRDNAASPALAAAIEVALADAVAVASGAGAFDGPERGEAIGLLPWGDREAALQALSDALSPEEPPEVQLSAIRALASLSGPEVGRIVVQGWRTYSPAVRREGIEVLFGREERLAFLLDALASGHVRASQLEPSRREALLGHSSAEIRQRARRVLSDRDAAVSGGRLDEYRAAVARGGDPIRGESVFARECASCHQLGGRGHDVGPNLAESAATEPGQLLADILAPNRSVQSNYVNYRLDTRDGRVVTGILVRESARAVTLRRGHGAEDVVSRTNIDSLASMGLSLMPEGLEDGVAPSEMADLIAFIRSRARP